MWNQRGRRGSVRGFHGSSTERAGKGEMRGSAERIRVKQNPIESMSFQAECVVEHAKAGVGSLSWSTES